MTDSLADLGARLAAAEHLDPAARFRALRDLAPVARRIIADRQDDALAEATGVATYEQVAAEVGVSVDEVGRRIKAHRKRTGAPSRRGRYARTPK